MAFVSMLKAHPGTAAAAAAVLSALIGLIVWLVMRRRPTPEEAEKRRRLMVNQAGRTIEGEISDADPHRLCYIYRVRGVEYSATQDVDCLLEYLPCEPSRVVGQISVKYLRNNAANSIVVCEEWSGLPARQAAMVPEARMQGVPPQEPDENSGCRAGAVPDMPVSIGGGVPTRATPRLEQE